MHLEDGQDSFDLSKCINNKVTIFFFKEWCTEENLGMKLKEYDYQVVADTMQRSIYYFTTGISTEWPVSPM